MANQKSKAKISQRPAKSKAVAPHAVSIPATFQPVFSNSTKVETPAIAIDTGPAHEIARLTAIENKTAAKSGSRIASFLKFLSGKRRTNSRFVHE